jgi:hypothetical protein
MNDGKLTLHVLLEFQGGPIETASLEAPSAWGDATHLEKGISNLTNTYHGGHIRVSYDMVKDWVVPPRARTTMPFSNRTISSSTRRMG